MNRGVACIFCTASLAALLAACTPLGPARVANTQSAFPTLATQPIDTPGSTQQTEYSTALPPQVSPLPSAAVATKQEAISLIGSGNMVVNVSKWAGPALLHARYGGSSNFMVSNYDAGNQKISVLVNTIGVYDGYRPLDILGTEHTVRFEVKAEGPWHLEILPIAAAPTYELPATVTQSGDYVFWLEGSSDLMKAESDSHATFVVEGYSISDGRALLVNTIAPYTGTVVLQPDTYFVVVQAEGPWSIDITAR